MLLVLLELVGVKCWSCCKHSRRISGVKCMAVMDSIVSGTCLTLPQKAVGSKHELQVSTQIHVIQVDIGESYARYVDDAARADGRDGTSAWTAALTPVAGDTADPWGCFFSWSLQRRAASVMPILLLAALPLVLLCSLSVLLCQVWHEDESGDACAGVAAV